jgi:hypothetical protein
MKDWRLLFCFAPIRMCKSTARGQRGELAIPKWEAVTQVGKPDKTFRSSCPVEQQKSNPEHYLSSWPVCHRLLMLRRPDTVVLTVSKVGTPLKHGPERATCISGTKTVWGVHRTWGRGSMLSVRVEGQRKCWKPSRVQRNLGSGIFKYCALHTDYDVWCRLQRELLGWRLTANKHRTINHVCNGYQLSTRTYVRIRSST